MGDTAVDGTMVYDVVEDNVTVDNTAGGAASFYGSCCRGVRQVIGAVCVIGV